MRWQAGRAAAAHPPAHRRRPPILGAQPACSCALLCHAREANPLKTPGFPTPCLPYAVAAVGLAWPALAPRGYMRWRVPALAALRFLLLALPYNFEEGLWDEVFPGTAASHRLAWALNLSNLAVGAWPLRALCPAVQLPALPAWLFAN